MNDKVENITVESRKGEFWACPCGNRADVSGFETSDRAGQLVEPARFWRNLYQCMQCGRIYDQTGNLVDIAPGDPGQAKDGDAGKPLAK